jgi:hypothetical protein
MVELGKSVTDRITGFSGVVTARTEFLSGSIRMCVESSKSDENGPGEVRWFDERRLADRDTHMISPGPISGVKSVGR